MLKIKPANTPNTHWYSGIFLFAVSLVFIFFAANEAGDEYQFRNTASRAQGVVVKQYSGPHHVEITFTLNDGRSITFSQNSFASFEVGEHVGVLYDPTAPESIVKADTFGVVWSKTIRLSLFGLGTLVMSILTIFFPKYIEINGPLIKKT